MDSLKKKSYKAFAWDFAGKLASQSVGFVISILLARLLSPEDFGLIAMVNIVVAISSGLIDMGLGSSLIQHQNVSDEHYGSVFFFNLAVGTILTAVLFFVAPAIGRFYNREILVPIARVMSLLFILNSLGNVIRIRLMKELQFRTPTQANLLGAFLSGVIGVAMAINGAGVWSLVAQALLMPVISATYLFIKAHWKPKLIFRWHALKDLWRFGFRMFLANLLDTVFVNLDSLIIGKLFSPKVLGHYYRAKSFNNYVIQYSSGSLMTVLFPAFSKVQNDRERLLSIVDKGYHLINFTAFFLTGLFFVSGDYFIILLFGEKWTPAIPMFRLIILTAYCQPLGSILVNIIKSSGNSRIFLRLEIIKKCILASSLAIGFIWGIEGYLICFAVAYPIALAMNMFFAERQLHLPYWWFLKISVPYILITVFSVLGISGIFNYVHLGKLATVMLIMVSYTLVFLGLSFAFNITGLFLLQKELQALNISGRIRSKLLSLSIW